MRTLLIGYGNPLRSDDGAAAYVVDRLDALKMDAVRSIRTQQLHLELIEEMVQFDRTIVIDAAVGETAVQLRAVETGLSRSRSSSHFMGVGLIGEMARALYGAQPNLHLCTIPADTMEFGTDLSPHTRAMADQAVVLISDFLRRAEVAHA